MSISAMKQALEALALVASSDEWLGCQTYEGQIATSAHEALSQAIAEAEKQEPVAFRNTETGEFCTGGFLRKDLAKWQPVYTTPVACDDDIYDIWVEQKPVHANDISQEPVDEKAKDRLVRIMGTFDLATGHADTLDQALDALEEELRDVLGHLRAMREWVGLTDADIAQTMHGSVEGSNMLPYQFARAIEAKLKEKNGG